MNRKQSCITTFLKKNSENSSDNSAKTSQESSQEENNTRTPVTAALQVNDDKPFHPPPDYSFPKTKSGSGSKLRSCQAHWFQKYPWLHYDEK